MVFSSIEFLCAFLPVLFIIYTALSFLKAPCKLTIQNWILIVASFLFYAYGEPVYILLLVVSALFNHICALFVSPEHSRARKPVLIAAVCVNLGILAFFKYTGMLVETFNSLSGLSVPVPNITLPIGISFFTFQILSYVIDVYRGTVAPQRDFSKTLLYIIFFPQLIAGPIVKFHDINAELADRHQTIDGVANGLRRFIVGLAKKVLVSNTVALAVDTIFAADIADVNIAAAWIAAVGYMLQIYFDFSGYSDMAIGMGEMFGFHFNENFNHPYTADSIRDFWRRWHISLSSWFKDYLYIPLGGNRRGRLRTCINKVIVFFCTGLWHGANWTFVLWGLYHGAFLIFEEYLPKKRKVPSFLRHIYVLLVVCVGFVLFRADTLTQAVQFIGQMFGGWRFDAGSSALALSQLTPLFIFAAGAGIIGSIPLKKPVSNALAKVGVKLGAQKVLSYCGALLLLVLCIVCLAGSTYNPFIYFRF